MTDNALAVLGKLFHFLFDLRQIFITDDIVTEVDIIIETFLNDRTDPELGMRIKMLDGLSHHVGTAVIQHIQFFVFFEIDHIILPEYKSVPVLQGRLDCAVPPSFPCIATDSHIVVNAGCVAACSPVVSGAASLHVHLPYISFISVQRLMS